jgi:hypothetical protein
MGIALLGFDERIPERQTRQARRRVSPAVNQGVEGNSSRSVPLE